MTPNGATLRWEGLQLVVGVDATVSIGSTDHPQGTNDHAQGRLRVSLPAPWVGPEPCTPECDDEPDSCGWLWRLGPHRASVRHRPARMWQIEVEVELADQPGGFDGQVPAPVLQVDAGEQRPPAWLMGLGTSGHAVLPLATGALVHWRHLGFSQLADADEPKASCGEVAMALLSPDQMARPGVHRSVWAGQRAASWAAVYQRVAGWVPPQVADAGDVVTIGLLDAAVTSDAGRVDTDETGSTVEVAPGPQMVTVATAAGTCRIPVVGVRSVTDDLRRRAERLMGSDPRRLNGPEAWLLAHAAPRVPTGGLLGEAAEELAAAMSRATCPDPFAVATLALVASGGVAGVDVGPDESGDLLAEAQRAVEVWRGLPQAPLGARLATAWVQGTSLAAGRPSPALLPVATLGLQALEDAVVRRDAGRGAVLLCTWLPGLADGSPWGMPTRPQLATALFGIVRCVPEQWRSSPDSSTGLTGDVVSGIERRLRAGSDADAAWLYW